MSLQKKKYIETLRTAWMRWKKKAGCGEQSGGLEERKYMQGRSFIKNAEKRFVTKIKRLENPAQTRTNIWCFEGF